MKWFFKGKDGGPESRVTGYWLVECKEVVSIVLLRFDEGSREAYHTHAFNAVSWVLKGLLFEDILPKSQFRPDLVELAPSFKPIFTPRERMHRVFGMAEHTWVLSFRGPWVDKWKEWLPVLNRGITLTHGRQEVMA